MMPFGSYRVGVQGGFERLMGGRCLEGDADLAARFQDQGRANGKVEPCVKADVINLRQAGFGCARGAVPVEAAIAKGKARRGVFDNVPQGRQGTQRDKPNDDGRCLEEKPSGKEGQPDEGQRDKRAKASALPVETVKCWH